MIDKNISLIPLPEECIIDAGSICIDNGINIVFLSPPDSDLIKKTRVFANKISKRFNINADVAGSLDNTTTTIQINLYDCQDINDESYKIDTGSNILISTASGKGLFNAFMTILQLIYVRDGSVMIRKATIKDKPRFSWRGTLIDPARNFLPVDTVKEYIDLICEFKLNVLHWHLVDDQGWRIESEAFPKLHRIGGIKGYYTKSQIRDIISYAEDRNIMIVPEIDMPGHVSALLAAYPELSCSGKEVQIRQTPGIFRTALCASKEQVYNFIDRLTGEIAELFPCPYIHIGSDEVVASDWLKHDTCIKLMEEKGIKSKTGLHAHFVARIDDILKKHGKIMIAWDEATAFLPDKSVLQAWRDTRYALSAAEKGHDVIISPTTHCYYDYPHIITSVEKVYNFNIIPDSFPPELEKHILGSEANLWGEWITPERLTKRAFPRILAHAEICWTFKHNKNSSDFLKRFKPVIKDLKNRGVITGCRFEPFILLWFGLMKLFEIIFIGKNQNK